MATNRFGYSDDFVLKNGKVGINTTEPQEKLDVVGVVKGQDLKVTGVSSFTTYEGFLEANHTIDESITLTSGTNSSLSGEIIVGTGVTVTIANVGLGTTTVGVGTYTTSNTIDTDEIVSSGQGGIDSLKVYNTFTVPTGGTEDRPIKVKPGQLYYNVDFKTIEFWDGNNWRQVDNTTRSGRAVWMGGNETNSSGGQDDTSTTSDTVIISTLGNAVDFGVLDESTAQCSAYGTSIEIFCNGYGQAANQNNFIQFAKFESGGNFEDFGDLTRNVRQSGSVNSSTRGCTAGGAGPSNVIDYNELQTKGNSIDFGDLFTSRRVCNCAFSSPTRGVFAGGASSNTATVEFITIASLGNGTEFGECTFAGGYKASSSNTTRGIQGGGPGTQKTIETHIISSGGNAVNFGDITLSRRGGGGASTQTRALFSGGLNPSDVRVNIIDYVNIASQGDAIDFGDITTNRSFMGSSSNSHGGLGGF